MQSVAYFFYRQIGSSKQVNGDKYLFWCDMHEINRMCVVKMKNWMTPDWSTARVMLYPNFYTEEDYHKSLAGETIEKVQLYHLLSAKWWMIHLADKLHTRIHRRKLHNLK